MTSMRNLSRMGNARKQLGRGQLEDMISAAVQRLIIENDPTVRQGAVKVAGKLAGMIASSLAVQTQVVQRALPVLAPKLQQLGDAFVTTIVSEAAEKFDPAIERFRPEPVRENPHSVAVGGLSADWAGSVAGPTVVERHFGIARSTLFRWQKRNEVVALRSGSSSRYVFPLKQFIDGRPADGIAAVIAIFADHRASWQWLMGVDGKVVGLSPIDLLLDGQVAKVIEAAKRFHSEVSGVLEITPR